MVGFPKSMQNDARTITIKINLKNVGFPSLKQFETSVSGT